MDKALLLTEKLFTTEADLEPVAECGPVFVEDGIRELLWLTFFVVEVLDVSDSEASGLKLAVIFGEPDDVIEISPLALRVKVNLTDSVLENVPSAVEVFFVRVPLTVVDSEDVLSAVAVFLVSELLVLGDWDPEKVRDPLKEIVSEKESVAVKDFSALGVS